MSTLPPVVLIDDDADDRELVSLVLRGALGEVTILEVANAADLARVVSERRFGIVVTEHATSFIRAGDVLRLIRDLVPNCPVLVLTKAPLDPVAAELLPLRPDGLLPKTSAGLTSLPKALHDALERVRRRQADARADDPSGDEMAYVVSHDLRQPLTQVVRYLELLEDEAKEKLAEPGRALYGHARDGARRLEGMLDALLRCARVESQGDAFTEVELGPLVERVAARLVEDGGAPPDSVRIGPLPRLSCDEGQVEQLFQNLLGNAFKFRRGDPPRAFIEAEDAGDYWRFSCRDNGIGIPPSETKRIFGMFQRLHTAAEIPGTGIGLALCRRIVARHGGRIWVESRPGEGSTFLFTLAKRPRPPRGEKEQ